MPDQRSMNDLVRRLTAAERKILGQMLAEQFEAGVYEALVVLHEAQVPPFEEGYEGTPFHDFVGRLRDWPWPQASVS
jgi:hypothetical protein